MNLPTKEEYLIDIENTKKELAAYKQLVMPHLAKGVESRKEKYYVHKIYGYVLRRRAERKLFLLLYRST